MLSVGKLALGQQQYYLDTVARGLEEYYTGAKEAPGVWVGSGSARLGLAGEVDADALGRVLEHVHPDGVYGLTAPRSVPVVAAYDATFSAPKSVSLLHALGPPEVSNEVRNAHDAAVAASLPVLEQVACRVRRGRGGHTVTEAEGFVAAAFRHRTSRAGDPQLHTHVVIANLAHSPSDGRWTALDGRPLYAWWRPVGYLYEAHLRWELTRRLGVEWAQVRNGIADIAGFPRPVLREFSTRRQEIEAHLEARGQQSARAAQYATYATRTAKATTVGAEGLLPGWRKRAKALGFDTHAVAAVLDRATGVEPPAPGSAEADRLYRSLAGPEGLTVRASTFGTREVIKAICNALPAGGRVDQVLDLVDGFLRSDHVLAITRNPGAATIRRTDGVVIPACTDEVRWTTPEMLQLEAGIVASALRRRAVGAGVTAPAVVEASIARSSLSSEQQAMIRAICKSGDGIEVVEGAAGAGKTYALAAAHQAWEASGYRVIGCSLAARAARQLQEDAGIPAATIDRLLSALDRHDDSGLDTGTVVVVDEAAMVGTRKLARLLVHAEAARAKVVLVGDACQLPEIDAGGAFRSLQHRLGACRLIDNRRQTQVWERRALAELRAGDADQAVDAYLRHQRVHQAPTSDQARELLVEHWLNARAGGDDALMVAARLADGRSQPPSARHAPGPGPARPRPGVLAGRALRTGRRGAGVAERLPPRPAQRHPGHHRSHRYRRPSPRRRHKPRICGGPVRLRNGRPPDAWLRHDHPQGPRSDRRPMLRARRRDGFSGACLHGGLTRAPRQRPLRRLSRPPLGGTPRNGSAARSHRAAADCSPAQFGAALRARRTRSRQRLAARPAPARTRPATRPPQPAATRPVTGDPPAHRPAPARAAAPRRRLLASDPGSTGPRQARPGRQTDTSRQAP